MADDHDTGQPPTPATQPTPPPTQPTPASSTLRHSQPQRAASQGLTAYQGTYTQETRMLRHALRILLDNPQHLTRQNVPPERERRFRRQLENSTDLSLATLKAMITQTATTTHVVQNDANVLQYSKSFLQQFNITSIVNSDTDTKAPAHSSPDDDDETVIEPPDPPPPPPSPPLSPDLLAESITSTLPDTPQPTPQSTVITPAPLSHQHPPPASQPAPSLEIITHIPASQHTPSLEYTAVNLFPPQTTLDSYAQISAQGDQVLANLDAHLADVTTNLNPQSSELMDRAQLRLIIEQELQSLLVQRISRDVNDLLTDLEARHQSVATTLKAIKRQQASLNQTNIDITNAIAKHQALLVKLEFTMTMDQNTFDRCVQQRITTFETLRMDQQKQYSDWMDHLNLTTMATSEREFQNRISQHCTNTEAVHTNQLNLSCNDQLRRLDNAYTAKHHTMTQDFDTLASDFQKSWDSYRQHQIPAQIHETVLELSAQTKDGIAAHMATFTADIDQQTADSISELRATTAELTQSIAQTANATLDNIRLTAKYEADALQDITSITTAISTTTQKSLDQLRSETGRLKKDLIGIKLETSTHLQNDLQTGLTQLQTTVEQGVSQLHTTHEQHLEDLRQHASALKQDIQDDLARHIHDNYAETPPFRQPSMETPSGTEPSQPTNSTPTPDINDSTKPPPPSSTPIFGQPGDSYEDRRAAYDARVQREHAEQEAQRRAQHIRDRSATVSDNLRHLHRNSFDVFLLDGTRQPSQTDITNFYQSIEMIFNSLQIPIVSFPDLSLTSGTAPTDDPLEPHVHNQVSQMLYTKMFNNIPAHWRKIRSILDTYATTRDGYNALFSIMTNSCGFLKIFRTLWGPTWTSDMTPFEYLTTLRQRLTEDRRYNQTYTPFEIAAEILQQANQHHRYKLITTTYLTRLQAHDLKTPLPPTFDDQTLIDSIDQNEQTDPNTHPTVHKIQQRAPRDGGKDGNTREPRKKFSFRREVQCTCCTTFGHDVDEDVCRIGAQVYSSHQFLLNHPDKAKKNAKAYAIANNKAKISVACGHYPDDTSWDEIQEHLLSIAHSFLSDDDNPAPPRPAQE